MGGDRESLPKPWRLFVAADVPESVRLGLDHDLERMRATHPELRWSPVENWHVTLKFLGAVWPPQVEEARSAIEVVAAETDRFDTRLLGADAFPSARRARVLWIGMSDPQERFPALAGVLDEALGRIVKPEERPFTPHLTVARAKYPVTLEEELHAVAGIRSETFPVDHVTLYRSHLRRPAPLYERVETFPLGSRRRGR
jgi:RNA 2',3'-cyclic 3'-phosphodiesterase